jgi:hypothetical protein
MEAWLMDNALQFDQNRVDQLIEQCFDGNMLKVMPADFYREFSQMDLYVFSIQKGIYCLPTTELLNALNTLILEVSPHRHAIEIGSGNGAIARGLGIPGTDNYLQSSAEMKAYYGLIGQATVSYGPSVMKLDANTAVEKMRPEVVIGAWVTHKYNPLEHHRGGNNVDGIDEGKILESVKRYIVVGNDVIHSEKPIMDKVTRTIRGDFIFSRSVKGVSQNAIYIWDAQ